MLLSPKKMAAGFLAALTSVALVATVAFGDTILHEYFILPPSELDPAESEGGESPSGEGEAEGFEAQEIGAPPPLTIENRGEELEFDASGRPSTPEGDAPSSHNGPLEAEDLAKPDRQTTLDSELTYFTVFNPSVVPWKRAAARDDVHPDYSLGVANTKTRRVEVKDRAVSQGRERFWGSVLIQMRPNRKVPLPSVAPDATILRYQTEPPTFLDFSKDGADNFFVKGNHDGPLRLNYLMEARSSYFGGEVAHGVYPGDLPRRLRPSLPKRLRESAMTVIEVVGVDTTAPLRDQLDKLVEYFRSFEARDFPDTQKSQNIYLDLALNKVGVCRHRAFAFTVTAQALGILSRYVHNEAHAFVEVRIPRSGWKRIDLGGAAVDFNVRNASDKTLHSPEEEDAFAQPENFQRGYSHQIGTGEPGSDEDGDGQPDSSIDGVPERDRPRIGPGDNPQPNPVPQDGESVEGAEEPGEDDFPDPDGARDKSTKMNLEEAVLRIRSIEGPDGLFKGGDIAAMASFREDDLVILGSLQDSASGRALAGQEVRAYILPTGKKEAKDLQEIGRGRTNNEGKARIRAKIPKTLALGRWGLYLYFSASDTHRATNSR